MADPPIPLPVDPEMLIESYEVVRLASRLWLRDPRPLGDGDERFAEFALVASDRLLWEPYVCAFGFSSETGQEPVAILSDLPFEALFADEFPPSEIPFLAYSSRHMTLPVRQFVGGSYLLAVHYRSSAFANSPDDLVCLESCLRDHPDGGEAFWRCMDEYCR